MTALTAVGAFRLDKAGIARAIGSRPDMAERLEVLAERDQAALISSAAMLDDLKLIPPETFLPRLGRFLHALTD